MVKTGSNSSPGTEGVIDTSRVPLGEKAAAALVRAIAASDDRVERHYLEIKGALDLTQKSNIAKIAKYILGSANRMPKTALAAFEGYGVMVIGVSSNDVHGVPPIEILEIEKVVSKYLGVNGPHWDLVRVPIKDSQNDVLIIVVDPPVDGQGPFICRRGGDDLIDGRVYIRADGETREAKSGELDQLVERATRQTAPDVAFEVEVVGVAVPVEVNEFNTLDAYVSLKTQERLQAMVPKSEPKPITASTSPTSVASAFVLSQQTASMLANISRSAGLAGTAFGTEPEKRTEEKYRSSISGWETEFRAAWPDAIDRLASLVLDGVAIRVINSTKTFFHDVELKIHLEGDVRGIKFRDGSKGVRRSDLSLPSPPRIWGPTQRDLFNQGPMAAQLFAPHFPSKYRSALDWNNSGSVDLTFNIGDLRPQGRRESPDDELVLVLPLTREMPIDGTWEITARDHNEVYTGELHVDVGDICNLTPILRDLLKLD